MKRIFRNTWLEVRPFEKDLPTDQFYIRLCNRLKELCYRNTGLISEFKELEEDDYDVLSCMAAAYFEDVVSGTGVFQTFVRICRQKCGKTLPFYHLEDYDEYLEDDINEPDLEFLIWYYMSMRFDYVVLPNDPCIATMAGIFFEELDQQWDYAPENQQLRDFFTFKDDPNDYFAVRTYMQKIFFSNYLTAPDASLTLDEEMEDAIEELAEQKADTTAAQALLSGHYDDLTYKIRNCLWGTTMTEWALAYVEDDSDIARNILTISPKLTGYFEVAAETESHYVLSRVSDHTEYRVLKKSLDANPLKTGVFVRISLIRWRGDWHWSGSLGIFPSFTEENIEDDRLLAEEQQEFLHKDFWRTARETIEKQHDTFLNLFNKDLIFGTKAQILHQYREFLTVCGADSAVVDRMEQETRLLDNDALLFFDEREGVNLAFGCNEAFCSVPCTRPKVRLEAFEHILFNPDCRIGLLERAVQEYVPHDEPLLDMIMELFREDFDFLVPFYKTDDILRRPDVTVTGFGQIL